MLNLLQVNLIDHHTDRDAIVIEDTDFIRCLHRAFDRRYSRPRQGSIHKRGTALGRGDHRYLATIANCFGCHWVAIVIDFHTHTIWHGNSLGWAIDPDMLTLLEWWTTEYSISKFTVNHLPITHQSDTFSCGLLAWNALANFFLPERFPLIAVEKVAAERLQLFLRISDHHQQHVKATAQTNFDYTCISLHPQASEDTEDSDFDMLESSSDEDGRPSQASATSSQPLSLSNQSDISDDDDDDIMPDTSNLARPTQKIQVESSLHCAVKANHGPLLKFFKPCTRVEYEQNLARDREVFDDDGEREHRMLMNKAAEQDRHIQKKEKARIRQQQHRKVRQENEIMQGIRSPGGRKRKVSCINLRRK